MKKSKPAYTRSTTTTRNRNYPSVSKYSRVNQFRITHQPQYTISPYRTSGAFPAFMDVKLAYADTIVLNPAIGSYTTYAFTANDVYDPDFSGPGHQPMNYDQYTAIYNKWVVTSSNIRLRPISSAAAAGSASQWIGVYLAPTTTIVPSGSESTFLEFMKLQRNASNAQLIGATEASNSDDIRFKRVGANYIATRDNAKKSISELDSSLHGAVSNGPSDLWHFICIAWSVSGNDSVSQKYSVEIDFNVRFLEPRQTSAS